MSLWILLGGACALLMMNVSYLQALANVLALAAFWLVIISFGKGRIDPMITGPAQGYAAAYLVWTILSLYLLRLVGLKPRFNRYFVVVGYVLGANQTTQHFVDSTAYKDAFGNIKVSSEVSSITTDHLTIWDEEAKSGYRISGQNKRHLASQGNFVGAGGFRAGDDSYFWNSGFSYKPDIATKSDLFGAAFLASIPVIGQLALAWGWLYNLVHGDGFFHEKSTQYDFQHFLLAGLVSAGLLAIFFKSPDFEQAFKVMAIGTTIFFLQALAARDDAIRFPIFLKQKVDERRTLKQR